MQRQSEMRSMAHHLDRPSPPVVAERAAATSGRALRVLVVESDKQAADTLVKGLRRHGHYAKSVTTGVKALRAHHSVDLVLLDLDLPDLDGLEVCRGIRATSETPITAVTARGGEPARVLGLRSGSDDYVVKPCGFRELLARIEAVMRRVRSRQPAVRVTTHGSLRIDADTRETRVNGRRVELTRKEFGLLHPLASQPGTVFSRRQLMTQVWDDARSRQGRTLDTRVSSLRGKLGSSSWIVTIRGVGFRLGHP
ncbi:response regulator transcription factor [Streptomyces sp. ST2-7A]|uniref:response regulator transcription factor n=1 Tax=Streptomyces sp. ST2-7A TaxID=2907214 RepID=UPI001F3DFBC4|nr:response regulator transcription factor [Streptomyces sp. ST2-7A]MCE7081228.1 response regulator transcription factor [Streptomyces sp. ST2-7A]